MLSVSRLCEALAHAGHHVKVLTTNTGLPELSEKELIEAIIDQPSLIERPIIIKGKKAIIARPPEKVLEII